MREDLKSNSLCAGTGQAQGDLGAAPGSSAGLGRESQIHRPGWPCASGSVSWETEALNQALGGPNSQVES